MVFINEHLETIKLQRPVKNLNPLSEQLTIKSPATSLSWVMVRPVYFIHGIWRTLLSHATDSPIFTAFLIIKNTHVCNLKARQMRQLQTVSIQKYQCVNYELKSCGHSKLNTKLTLNEPVNRRLSCDSSYNMFASDIQFPKYLSKVKLLQENQICGPNI